jgi:hypothetical protein
LDDKIKEYESGGACSTHTNVYKVLVWKSEVKRPFKRLRCGSEVSIKMDLREIGWIGFIWHRIGTRGGLVCW